jgi:rod shape-determining protein MreC
VAISRRTGRSRLTLALLILTSLAVLTLDFRDTGVVEGARRAAATVFSPFRGVARTVSSPFSDAWNGVTDYGDLEKENDELQERLADIEGDRAAADAAIAENEALKDLLDLPFLGDIPTVVADVIGGPPSNFSHTIEIGKGTGDGVQEGMPVVTGAGLVGIVVQATSGSATVQLITDPDFAVGVRLVEQNVPGTARGQGEGEDLIVDTPLDAEEDVEAGTPLVTSGSDVSRFPAGIPVGDVRSTRAASGGLTRDLIVEPHADTNRLPFVKVLQVTEPAE